jgi:hypothetical protein
MERDNFEDIGVDWRIIKKNGSSGNRMGKHGLNDLAQDRDRWRTVVNAVLQHRVA